MHNVYLFNTCTFDPTFPKLNFLICSFCFIPHHSWLMGYACIEQQEYMFCFGTVESAKRRCMHAFWCWRSTVNALLTTTRRRELDLLWPVSPWKRVSFPTFKTFSLKFYFKIVAWGQCICRDFACWPKPFKSSALLCGFILYLAKF